MIELTIKTLDSKNHSFSVPDDFTVKQLKEHIADTVNIGADSQRLIYCGRVLQDDKNLTEYDVNGKVIHLVQRAPPVNSGGHDRGPAGARSATGTSGTRRTPQWRTLFGGPGGNSGNAMYLGAMAFPAEIMDATGMSMQQPRQCLSQSRLAVARNMLNRASVILGRLENPTQESTDASPDNRSAPPEPNADGEGGSNNTPPAIAALEISPGSFIVDNTLTNMQVGNDVVVQTSESGSESNAAHTANEQQPQQNETEEEGNNSTSRVPRTQSLAELMDLATEVNTRVQPFMAQYQQLMRDDPPFSDRAAVATNQRLFTSVSEVMHNLAHAYHALSDIICDFSQPPPRFLRCRPVLIHHSALVQTGIPIQVSGNLAANLGSQVNANNSNARRSNSRSRPAAPVAGGGDETVSQETPAVTAATSTTTAAADSTSSTTASADSTSTTTAAADSTSGSREEAPASTPPRTARIGSGGPGFEFFVDVAPGSITIDSLEATVVTNGSPSTSEATNTWQNPPEFVQNLISALAGQFMGATLQQYRFPDQPASTSSNQIGATTQPNVSSANGQAAASSQSGASSANNQPTASIPAQNSQARGNTATHPTTATQTRSTPRPHVHLAPSTIHGLRTNFDPFLPCNSHHIRNNNQQGVRERPAQVQTGNGTNSSAPPVLAPGSISISLRADPVIGGSQQQPGRSSNRQRPPQPALPFELQALFDAMRTTNANLQNPTTLTQLLQNVPGYSYTPGESILTDIFMTLAQTLSFLDMVQLGLGSSECLVRAQPQLRQLISERLLNNEPLTIAAITQVIDRFNDELRPYYSVLNNARLRDEVDLPASINLYNHSMLPSIVDAVMEEDQSTFHRTLLRKCTLYVRQLCALLQYCCLDGVTGLESILQAFVNQMTTGVPLVLQEWTMLQSVNNFRTFVSTLNVPVEDIKRFLVYRVGNSTSPLPATTPPLNPPAAEPMDIQDIHQEETSPIPSFLREPPAGDIPPNDVIGWQNALPSEWVPWVTRDERIQRQRRQNPQGPFSDAYLSGMPSKRRKLITSAKPQGNLSQVISESMATALGAAGMSSGPEVDVIAQRAGQDTSLRAAYREQVRSTVCSNLTSNPDYLPDKYPNTAKYFKKQ